MTFYIKKMSGYKEPFDADKFAQSLSRAGAQKTTIQQLIKDIERNSHLRSTKKIYAYALASLHKKNPVAASRYNIKQALLELGPAGFPFEQFVSALFIAQGYSVKTNNTIKGYCVDHEIDVIVTKDKKDGIVECKYHNKQQLKTDVKVTLYTKARFDDITKKWQSNKRQLHHNWIVTNTKFTSEALKYATCTQINLLSWDYPYNNSLIHIINTHGLHPITALVSLNKEEKKALLKKGFVLCKDAYQHAQSLKELGIKKEKIERIIHEALAVCKIP